MNPYAIEDIHYMVSLFCPGECVNCSIWQEPKEKVTKGELDTALFEKLLQGKLLAGVNYFDLTAGESQLSEKYLDVVRLIARYKPAAFIHTNISGWYPKKHFEVVQEALKYIPKEQFRIDISLDGREENYKKVRKVENGFAKVMDTVERLKTLTDNLRFVMVMFRETQQDMEWLIALAKEKGVGYYIGYPRGSINYFKSEEKRNYYTARESEAIEKRLFDAGWLSERRLPNWLWAKSIYAGHIPYFECHMGKRHIVIDPYGNVYPCNEMLPALHMGNLNAYGGDIDALLMDEKALSVIKHIEAKKCQPCGMLCAHKVEFPWGLQSGMQATTRNSHV